MKKNNLLIRLALAEAGLFQYQAAEILGISEQYFCKLLRKELPEEVQMEWAEKIKLGGKGYAE